MVHAWRRESPSMKTSYADELRKKWAYLTANKLFNCEHRAEVEALEPDFKAREPQLSKAFFMILD